MYRFMIKLYYNNFKNQRKSYLHDGKAQEESGHCKIRESTIILKIITCEMMSNIWTFVKYEDL